LFIKTIDDDFLDGDSVVGILGKVGKRIEWLDIIDVVLGFPNITNRVALEGITIDRIVGDKVVVPERIFDGLARRVAVFRVTINGQIRGANRDAER
jgi:ATP-dependent RNA circularization protein (DNA/RNA ligase family)